MQNALLFADSDDLEHPPAAPRSGNPDLKQWFTPEWCAEALVEQFLPNLSSSDFVLEPSCGPGAFLKAIPEDVPALGVEIDPMLARIAREQTGRQVITGDFTQVNLPEGITAIVGNPPFDLDLFERFLSRSNRLLPDLSSASFLLPAYFFNTFGRVNAWREHWSMKVHIIPRGLFPGITCPLTFCAFTKDGRRDMVGFALYAELGAVRNLSERAQKVLESGRPHKSVWRALVEDTLQSLGGRATLDQIYRIIEPRRPSSTAFWREKIRQQLQQHFVHCGRGEYAMAA
jgi:site-specific DNA-methyltransferase (adenine-specific)